MAIFFTSDTHFYHINIIKYCNRPFTSIKEMNDTLISNWNNMVTNNDVVFVLGDFAFKHEYIAKELNGIKIFIKGNHDNYSDYSSLSFYHYDGRLIYIQHRPYPQNIPSNTSLILCGHVHNNWESQIYNGIPMINVGVDVWGFKPVELNRLLQEAVSIKATVLN